MKKANKFMSCMAILACGCLALNGSATAKDKGFIVKGSLEGQSVYLVSAAPGAADTLKALNPVAVAPAVAAAFPATPVGGIAPDFTLPTPDGETLSLHGVKAKLKLIDFWASWCGPCRAENPNVVKVYAEYHSKGLEIISVSLDSDREKWLKAIEDDHMTWLHGSDLQGWKAAPAPLYGVRFVPYTVLVDENNKIIALNLRSDALRAKIAELLD